MADIVEVNVQDGIPGTNGWSPMLRVVPDGERRVVELFDWTGGSGTKPAITGYLSDTGVTQHIAEATNIRGASGSGGGGSAEWGDISGSIQDQTDLWNELQSKLESIDWDGIDGKPDVIASGATQAAARTSIGLGSAATADITDFATAAQGAKADTALQSFTETDPTVPAHVKSISSGDISSWNGKQNELSVPSQEEVEAGTAATARSITAQRIRQGANAAIAASNKISSAQEGGVGTVITNHIAMTQAQYDGLATKNPSTVYEIIEE